MRPVDTDEFDGGDYEFAEVIDSIVECGRFNETLLLLREIGESISGYRSQRDKSRSMRSPCPRISAPIGR